MKRVCVLDLDETLGHYNASHEFLIRPHAYLLLDFLTVTHFDVILWSLGSDSYVEHVINTYFDDFTHKTLTRVFGRSVCEISKRKYGSSKHSKIIRNLYKETIDLIAIDDQVAKNTDAGYDCRIQVEPYTQKNTADEELLHVLRKIIQHLKETVV